MLARDERPSELRFGWRPCHCTVGHHARLVPVTGGPGAGKSRLRAELRRSLCEHVVVLPEAASVVFGGGFPPIATGLGRTAAQRSIYRFQLEFERVAIEDGRVAVALCDRGTIDGMAYWPSASADCLSELGTRHERELERYAAVVATLESFTCVPRRRRATMRRPRMRLESAHETMMLDDAHERAWAGLPRRLLRRSAQAFEANRGRAFACIRDLRPSRCGVHVSAQARDRVCEPLKPTTAFDFEPAEVWCRLGAAAARTRELFFAACPGRRARSAMRVPCVGRRGRASLSQGCAPRRMSCSRMSAPNAGARVRSPHPRRRQATLRPRRPRS